MTASGCAIGLIGLPNSGKSTLFNALTRAHAEVAGYPFSTKSSNVGTAVLLDDRLQRLAEAVEAQRVVPEAVTFIDVAGLVKGASEGEGLGNQFLGYIRDVDALAHVVRCFDEPDVAHIYGDIDPVRDIETVSLELILADLTVLERRWGKVARQAKSGDRDAKEEQQLLFEIREALERGEPVRSLALRPEQRDILAATPLLTAKPLIYIANVAEDELAEDGDLEGRVAEQAKQEGVEAITMSARIESELAELDSNEADNFLEDLGLPASALTRLVVAAHRLLGLITFFTIESQETKAWTIRDGASAVEAAGAIHSDMERGFIKAEVAQWQDVVNSGSWQGLRESGHLLIEGRDYRVRDGDVMLFKFAA